MGKRPIKVENEVIAVIPHSDDLMKLASEGIFAMRYPEHPVTSIYNQIANKLMQ